MSPDRVPPPATRTLLPGTAQPYYPGDPVPNSPAIGTPAPAYTPGTTYAPAPTTPTTPTTPPGGWNGYPQPAPGTPPPAYPNPAYGVRPTSAEVQLGPNRGSFAQASEQPVEIHRDNESLRFAQARPSLAAAPSVPVYQSAPPAVTPSSVRMPIQSMVPSPYANRYSPSPGSAQLVDYQTPTGQPSYVQPAWGAAAQPVQIRAVPSANLPSAAAPARDGFRPQGSRAVGNSLQQSGVLRTQATDRPRTFGAAAEATERFGYGPQYQWLRGQLQYSQVTNQWKLRYIPIQGNTDQFGGSVLLANPHVLGNLRPGDHVLVRGRLQARETDVRSFAPLYTVSVVQRQR